MDKLRLRFEKTGKAIWISHLDLMRVMQRAFLRAGCRMKYSEGFNPHPILSVCLPLSVGAASRCELMDFRLDEAPDLAALPARLTAAMPEGIRVLEVYPAERKITELKWLRAEGRLEYDAGGAEEKAGALEEFFSRRPLTAPRRTKRGPEAFDLGPHLNGLLLEPGEGAVRLEAVISAQDPVVNPELLIAALREGAPALVPDFAAFTRLETYDAEMRVFR